MPSLDNSVTISELLQIITNVVGRRTTKTFSVTTIKNTIEELKNKHDFLDYIKIEDSSFTEKKNDISVDNSINNIESQRLEEAINDIFDVMMKSLGKNVGYFYIKEIKDDLEKEISSFFEEFEVNLNLKQQEHLLEIMESSIVRIQEIKNSEVLNITISAVVKLINRKVSEDFTKDSIMNILNKLKTKYEFLKYVNIIPQKDSNNKFEVSVNPEINNILIAERGNVIENIIFEIGKASNIEVRPFFGEKFEYLVDNRDLSKLKRIGVKIGEIEKKLRREGHQILLVEIFSAIIKIIEKKISTEFGVKYINALINKLKDKHEVLKNISIDTNRLEEGINAININSKINNVDSEYLAKAIKDMLSRAQADLKELTHSFISEFEKVINKEIKSEISKIGVNLHILELRAF